MESFCIEIYGYFSFVAIGFLLFVFCTFNIINITEMCGREAIGTKTLYFFNIKVDIRKTLQIASRTYYIVYKQIISLSLTHTTFSTVSITHIRNKTAISIYSNEWANEYNFRFSFSWWFSNKFWNYVLICYLYA